LGGTEGETEKEENVSVLLPFKYNPCYLFSNNLNKEFSTKKKIIKLNVVPD
jgi:hypothetical protein